MEIFVLRTKFYELVMTFFMNNLKLNKQIGLTGTDMADRSFSKKCHRNIFILTICSLITRQGRTD